MPLMSFIALLFATVAAADDATDHSHSAANAFHASDVDAVAAFGAGVCS